MEKKMETTTLLEGIYWGYSSFVGNKGLYWAYIGIS